MSRLTTLELPAAGVTLKICRIPYMLLEDWRKGLPEPPPVPRQEVDYAGVKKMEENPSHPSYVQAMNEHGYKLGMLGIEFAIDRGVVVEVDQAAVDELRQWAAQQVPPVQLPTSDKVVFISRILVPDLVELLQIRIAVFGRIAPTQEMIDRAVDGFRSNLSGEEPVRLADQEISGELQSGV